MIINLNNLIPNGSFESNAQWSGITYDSSVSLFGSRSQLLPAGGVYVSTCPMSAPIVGHVYYGRHYKKTDGNNQPADCRFEWYGGDGVGLNFVFGLNNGDHPEWTLESSVLRIDAVNASSFVCRSFVVNGTANLWNDGMMIVDLTAGFGSGNEPNKEWCDANIPFFTDSVYEYSWSTTGLRQTGKTANSITIAWDTDVFADGWRVYRDGVLVAAVNTNAYTDSGLLPTETHSYTVTAYNSAGNSEPAQIIAETETAVSGLKQTVKTSRRITISWSWDSTAAGWKIYKDGVYVASVATNSYTEDGLLPAETHTYKVVAYAADGEYGAAEIVAETEWAWYIEKPVIKSMTVTPSIATTKASVMVSVTVDEVLLIAENMHSGEIFAGEV